MTPRVSIITPSYQQSAYLEQTLNTVLEQEYPDLEYWVMDGGSTDGSLEIIQRYAGRLAGWVSEKDNGQGDAINKGFARATGEIVAWINSDDYYLPGAIAEAVRILEANPRAGMVFGDVLAVDGAGQPINLMRYGMWGLEELMRFEIIGQPSVFMRRSVLEQAGFLDTSYHLLLDHHLWLRMAQRGEMVYVPRRWSAARYHPAAKNVAQAPRFAAEVFRLVEWMQSDPGLSEVYQRDQRRIQAGAHRLAAFYLLDGGLTKPALGEYFKSLAAHPLPALKDARRILYAAASLVFDVERLKKAYLERRRKNLRL